MTRNDRIVYTCFMCIACMAISVFAYLWFFIGKVPTNFNGTLHILDFLFFAVVTYVIWHPIFMELITFIIARHIKPLETTSPHARTGAKVAFVTTFVPGSESIDLLHKILPAMKKANYAHDTWLLDEGDDPAVKDICKQYKVNHFSRHGIETYNQHEGKYAKKTKGGNHNSWYDSFGDAYDFVAQIDTDFVPKKDFLTRTLGYFNNPSVAFVGTPQIYGNVKNSFIAHGAAEQTYSFYGPLLRGMSGVESSMLIGANHVIRVAALREVDHYSAHITEDLLTGMKLHANGWKSVYCPVPLAIGEGPITWKAYFNQQKRWAYGCMHILFNHSFRLLRKMPLRQKIYYFSIQQYYFSGLAMVLGIFSLSLYFFGGITSTDIGFYDFLPAYAGVVIVLTGMQFWLQRFNARPDYEKGMLWFGMLTGMIVWPVYFQAFFQLFKRKKLVYKVTPKGKKVRTKDMSLKLFIPHMILGTVALAGCVSSIFTDRDSVLMIFWSIVTGISLLTLPFIPYIFSLKTVLGRRTASEPQKAAILE